MQKFLNIHKDTMGYIARVELDKRPEEALHIDFEPVSDMLLYKQRRKLYLIFALWLAACATLILIVVLLGNFEDVH